MTLKLMDIIVCSISDRSMDSVSQKKYFFRRYYLENIVPQKARVTVGKVGYPCLTPIYTCISVSFLVNFDMMTSSFKRAFDCRLLQVNARRIDRVKLGQTFFFYFFLEDPNAKKMYYF